jgi:hypothetical protein
MPNSTPWWFCWPRLTSAVIVVGILDTALTGDLLIWIPIGVAWLVAPLIATSLSGEDGKKGPRDAPR